MSLNADQQSAVECDGNLLVLAPPGSGKTGTLVEKTRYLIEGSSSSRVVVCTFTDAAATEVQERLAKLLNREQIKRVQVGTFHKLAISQLRSANRLGRILSPYESTNMLKQALSVVGSTMDIVDAETQLQAAKSTPSFTGQEDDVIAEYERRKQSHRAIDLQDIIRECVKGMATAGANGIPLIAPLPASDVLCDEFQDVDSNQLHWLLSHHKAGAILTVVGDDDQSVYGWRNSLGYKAMEEFIAKVRPRIINLSINYRSRSEILRSATELIRHNTARMDKRIIAYRGDGGSVRNVNVPKKREEAAAIAEAIIRDAETNGFDINRIPKGRWGIIGRNNTDLFMVSVALRSAGIPHSKAQNKDDTPWSVRLLCGLLVSIQTNDTVGLVDTLSALGISQKTIALLMSRLGEDFFSLMDRSLPSLDDIPLTEQVTLKDFGGLCSNWRHMTVLGEYSRVIGGVADFFLSSIVRGDEAKDDFNSFVDLLCGTPNYDKRKADASEDPIRAKVYQAPRGDLKMRVMQVTRMQDDKQQTTGVSLRTMHGSKGLEFDNVFIVQCNAGKVPSAKSTSVEEERCLFYVAMTRARVNLTMTYNGANPSSFLREFSLYG